MNRTSGIVAVKDSIAVAGCVCFWRLSGEVDHEELCEAWKAAGLPEDMTPGAPTAARALTRAMNELQDRRHIVRPLPKGGFALVRETAEEDDNLDHAVVLTARVGGNDELLVSFKVTNPNGIQDENEARLADTLRTAFERNKLALSTTDVSNWLAIVVHKYLQAVSLRDLGGIYFVPATSMGDWRKVAQAVRDVSLHFVAEIPAMRSSEAVATILDAIEREAEGEVEQMMAGLADGSYKKRALEGRVERCAKLDAKVSSYEALLGTHLPKLRDRIEGVRASMTVAILELDEENEKERERAIA